MGSATKEKKDTLDLIEQDMGALEDYLFEVEGVIPDEDAEKIVDELFAELGERKNEKLNGYAWAIKRALAVATQKREQADIWTRQAKRLEERVDFLKTKLLGFIQRHGVVPPRKETREIDTGLYRLCEQRNGGKQPIAYVHGDDYSKLPETLRQDTITLKVTAEHAEVAKIVADIEARFGAGAVTVTRESKPIDEAVRGALDIGVAARDARVAVSDLTEEERPITEDEDIFQYADYEPRGVHLRIY